MATLDVWRANHACARMQPAQCSLRESAISRTGGRSLHEIASNKVLVEGHRKPEGREGDRLLPPVGYLRGMCSPSPHTKALHQPLTSSLPYTKLGHRHRC